MKNPIWSEDAEQSVLSAAMMEPEALAKARAIVGPDAFFRSAHTKFFAALCTIADRGEVPDPVTISEYLIGTGELDAVGGKDYIGFLVDTVPTAANVEYHAKIVREKADRRGLIATAETLIEGARDLTLLPDAVAQRATSDLLPVAAHTRTRGFVPISEVIVSVFEDIHARRTGGSGMAGSSWGYAAIDFETGGFRPGEVAFFCGVPASGKTALALNIAQRVADRTGRWVAIVSAEMGTKALIERILNTTARINSKAARKGEIDAEEWSYMVKVGASLKSLPLSIDDTAQPRINDILAKCRAEKAKRPTLALLIVDFIQLLKDGGDDNRSLELTDISYALKGLAKELQVAIIVTCQVDAAAVEKTTDQRPQLHHLRWSQGMREAGDFICLIHNDGQTLELGWRKARELPPFTVRLKWVGEFMLVDDFAVRAIA